MQAQVGCVRISHKHSPGVMDLLLDMVWLALFFIPFVTSHENHDPAPISDSPFNCTILADGVYVNPFFPCSNIYYECKNGNADSLVCPVGGQVFSPLTRECTNILNVNECLPGLGIPEFNCTGLHDGNYENPLVTCSRYFFTCMGELTVIRECLDNETRYDHFTNECRMPANVPSCSEDTSRTETTMGLSDTTIVLSETTIGLSETTIGFTETTTGLSETTTGFTETMLLLSVTMTGLTETTTGLTETTTGLTETTTGLTETTTGLTETTTGLTETTTGLTETTTGFTETTTGLSETTVSIESGITETTEMTSTVTEISRLNDHLVEFDCSDKADGNYADPAHNYCSSTYFSCQNGHPTVRTCPSFNEDPKLYYDAMNDTCLLLEDVLACQLPTTAPDTAHILEFSCERLPDGSYADPTSNCSSIWYSCSGGVVVAHDCLRDFFDEVSGSCKRGKEVAACKDYPGSRYIPPFDCSNHTDGNYPDPEKACSDLYFSCINGEPMPRNCYLSYYDVIADVCKSFEEVSACSHVQNLTESPIFDIPADFCLNRADGDYSRTPNECSRFYITCKEGGATPRECVGLEYAFDEVKQQCDNEGFVSVCATQTRFTEFNCTGRPDGHYVDPDQPCSRSYFVCKDGLLSIAVCVDDSLRFDPLADMCVEEGSIDACTMTSVSPQTLADNATPHPPIFDIPADFCLIRADGDYSRIPNECSRFYITCKEGVATPQVCVPSESVFDEDKQQCDGAGFVSACATQTNFTQFNCTGIPDGHYVDPDKPCSRSYFVCKDELISIAVCVNDSLRFDPLADMCVEESSIDACMMTTMLPQTLADNSLLMLGEFDCSDTSKEYPVVLDSCEPRYISCATGTAQTLNCPPNTYFDQDLGICEENQFVLACGGTPRPDNQTFHQVQPDIRIEPFSCTDKPDGNYQSQWEACGYVYFSCEAHTSHMRLCNESLRFDNYTDSCLEPQYVESCGGKLPENFTDHMRNVGVVAIPSFSCEDKVNNRSYAISEDSCYSVYAYCDNGQPIPKECDSDMVFDGKTCQFARFVPHCGGQLPEQDVALPIKEHPAVSEAPEFSCIGRNDGNFQNPDHECSAIFFSCAGQRTHVRLCATPELRYDSVTDSCLGPEYVPACGGKSIEVIDNTNTTNNTTSTQERILNATSQIPPAFTCENLTSGDYPVSPDACSQVFITCANNKPIAQLCPPRTAFDATLKQCAFPDQVSACGGTPAEEVHNVDQMSDDQRIHIDFDCSNRKDGSYADPRNSSSNSGSCSSSFIVCHQGIASVFNCAPSTFFDEEMNVCNFWYDVPACTGANRTTVAPTVAPKTDPNFRCQFRQGNIPPNDTACPEYFYQCSNGRGFRVPCPKDLKYHAGFDKCLDAQDVPGCQEFVAKGPCSGKINGFYADQESCSTFWVCIDGQEFRLNCGNNEIFNPLTSHCENGTATSGQVQNTTCAKPVNGSLNFTCGQNRVGLFAMPADCTTYASCEQGKATMFRCPEGHAFWKQGSRCVPAVIVDGCSPPTDDSLQEECKEKPDGFYAHSSNCHMGVACMRQKAIPLTCVLPDKPAFDPVSKTCVQPTDDCQ